MALSRDDQGSWEWISQHLTEKYIKPDFRYQHYDEQHRPTGEFYTYKETLEAMARTYGTFCGRWHDNEFWKKQLELLPDMSEEEAEQRVRLVEYRANQRLGQWQQYN